MRYFLLLAALGLLLGAAGAAPLPADIIRIDRLPTTGLVLQKGWRYHPGDDPAWARPGFDDRAWDTLNPTRPRRELPAAAQTGISWLRLRFRLSDSLRGHILAIHAYELGACEIYLNGRLLMRQGVVSTDPARVVSRGRFPPPGEVPAGGPLVQVLAVRYVPWQPPLPGGGGLSHQPQQLVYLFTARQFWEDEARQRAAAVVLLVAMGVMGLLTLLHFAFFRYNPARRANLYFAGFALAATLGYAANYGDAALTFPTQVPYLLVQWSMNTLMALSSIWAVRALYALFGVQTGRVYAGLWLSYGGLALALALLPYHPVTALLTGAFQLVAAAEQLRLTGRALRQGRRGAWIIGAGFAGGMLAVFGLLPQETWSVAVFLDLLLNLLKVLIVVLPALGISLFLAREFALDSQLLQVKLGEVENLSARTLVQEQEKQVLLAQQNETLEQQVAERTGELERSLMDLRATQAQLIQKEKMASLGELTAGIAHEIQNPLNFVNNFSEVSGELVAELKEAQAAGDAAEVTALADDLGQNLGKISHHGRRAAAIVRGMLEHSRTSTGARAPTDLNQLCDEYLRLAYQGLRAKDKRFNATLKTDFASDLPLVEAAGADVGRVLLNLFGNAFYAVQQRQQTGEAGYAPTVSVSTRQVGEQVEIRVADNGTGIPAEVQAKIFQPFFTTKPTGEGTGLGLSLSYDIITKAHGGTLAVESHEGRGTAFMISLPRGGKGGPGAAPVASLPILRL